MKGRFRPQPRRWATGFLVAALLLSQSFDAIAQESPAAPGEASPPGQRLSPTETLCAGQTGDDLNFCQQLCTELPASPGCLFARRFGAVGVGVLMIAREENRDPEEVGREAGMTKEEAHYLMLVLDADGALPRKWVDEKPLTASEEAALTEATSANQHAFRLYHAGKYREAVIQARHGLTIREKILGPDHPDTLTSVNNLAALLRATGDYAGAEPLYRRALETHERVLGPEHPVTLISVNNLATLLQATGDYAGAEPLYRRALETHERVLGPEHPNTLTSVNSLAGLLDDIGDYAGAEPLYRRALETRERVLGPEHPDTLTSVNNLALLLQATGDYAGAEPLYRRALETRERVLGPEHPDTLISVNNLAFLLKVTGDYAGAEPLYRRALETRERVLGPEHPNTLTSVNNLAVLLDATGDYAGAEPLYRRALETQERVLGPEHPDTLISVNNLAGLLIDIGDYAGAEPLYRRALETRERVLGPEHPDTLLSVNNLAGLLVYIGDYAGAEPLCRRALETYERVLGPEHPNTLISMMNLSTLKWVQGDLAGAKRLSRTGIRGIREHFQRNMDVAKTDQSVRAFLDSARHNFFGFLSLFVDPGDESEVFEQVLAWQGAATAATMLINDLERAERNAPPAQKDLFVRYREASREHIRLLMTPVKDDAGRAERTRGLKELTDELARLEQDLSSENVDFRSRRALIEATPKEVCESLKANDAGMVVYVRYARVDPNVKNLPATPYNDKWSLQYVGLVISPEGCEVSRIELGDAERLDTLVQTYRTTVDRVRECIESKKPHPDAVGHICAAKLAEMDAAAETVREKVWDPLAKALPPSGRIYVVPDGSLVDVPFGSLPTGTLPDGKTKYLIEDRDLAYFSSPRDAMRLGQPQETDGEGALVMGWVDYKAAQAMPMALAESEICQKRGCTSIKKQETRIAKAEPAPKEGLRSSTECGWATSTWLAGMGQDAPVIAEALGRSMTKGALLTTDWHASEGLLRQEMPGKRILHLSSHGFYSSWEECRKEPEGRQRLLKMAPKRMEAVGNEKWTPDPLTLTGLVLAGADVGAVGTDRNDPMNDGILSGREIADLDLTSAEVVVLAACETGRGNKTWGEGALGLGKAFLVAGARQVVMALWQVPDIHTENLFQRFYQGITPKPTAPKSSKSGKSSAAKTGAPSPEAHIDSVAALRNAQLELLNDARNRLGLVHSSYLWGAFVPMVRGN